MLFDLIKVYTEDLLLQNLLFFKLQNILINYKAYNQILRNY